MGFLGLCFFHVCIPTKGEGLENGTCDFGWSPSAALPPTESQLCESPYRNLLSKKQSVCYGASCSYTWLPLWKTCRENDHSKQDPEKQASLKGLKKNDFQIAYETKCLWMAKQNKTIARLLGFTANQMSRLPYKPGCRHQLGNSHHQH